MSKTGKTPAAIPAYVMTVEMYDTLLANIAKSGAAYAMGIGRALLGALYFSVVNHDAKPANALVNALRKSTKQQAIIDLLQENGNLAWTKVGKKPGFEFYDAMHTWLPEDVKELRTVCEQWEDYKNVAAPKDYDAIAALEQIVKNIDSKTDKGVKVIGASVKEDLQAALAKYQIALYGEVF